MLTDKDLQELLETRTHGDLLSVYLNTDPATGQTEDHKARLRSLLKDSALEEDAAAIERYFEHEYTGAGRSAAVFSCAESGFFRAYPLAVPTRDRVRVANRPYVKPLAALLDDYGGYGIALVDKQGVRLFYFHLGRLTEHEGVAGEDVRRSKSGGGTQGSGRRGGMAIFSRRADKTAERNLRSAAKSTATFFADLHVRRILLAGTDDNVAFFRQQLPKRAQSLIVGTFPMSMNANHNEIQVKALEVGRAAEVQREARLVEAATTGAAKGQTGVIRLEDTLGAVHEGRVQTLLIMDGLRTPGYRCKGCGFLTTQKMAPCPFCGDVFIEIPDAVEQAVRKVLQEGGEVEILRDNPALEKAGGIAALLRY